MSKATRPRIVRLPTPPLLITESQAEFDGIHEALCHEIRPRGIIERMYILDFANLIWEIGRLRRCRANIIKLKFRRALYDVLCEVLDHGEDALEFFADTRRRAREWFEDSQAKKEILADLNQYELDESAIDAVAIKKMAEELEHLDRLLVSLESRRDKALRNIAEYRRDLAKLLRDSGDRIIEGKVLALEQGSGKKSSAA
jgi:hypothetical protein